MLLVSISLGQSLKGVSLDYSKMNTDFYYYKGRKIPLTLNEYKVCISMPKDDGKTSGRGFENVKVFNTIADDSYDIYVVSQSDYERLMLLDSWKEHAESIIVTPSYRIMDETEVFLSPYLNVRLKREQDIDMLTSYAERYGLKIVEQDKFMPLWYILTITPDSKGNSLECANELWESGMFAVSVPDLCYELLLCSNDPQFNQQWGLYNSDNPGMDISASAAWNYATGKDVKIAIMDSGVDLNHIDLSPNISSMSYDTNTDSSSIASGSHATHCAGIAAAVKDNGIHIAGVAPEATIVSISITTSLATNNSLQLAHGFVWAYQHDVDIISNSWHTVMNPAIDEAIQNAFIYGRQGKGCVIAFASGNRSSNSVNYPANCNDTILAVGAIDKTGTRASFSNYGSELDLVAPGVDILSTIPNNQTDEISGTSMACPHVAGVAALILERNPELTVTQVNSIISSNTKKLSGVNFNFTKPYGTWNEEYGYGLVDAYASVINTPSLVYIQNETITGTRTISASNICVGTNVTNSKEYGDVTLGPGNITLNAGCIEIRDNTTVPLGTTLTIEN